MTTPTLEDLERRAYIEGRVLEAALLAEVIDIEDRIDRLADEVEWHVVSDDED